MKKFLLNLLFFSVVFLSISLLLAFTFLKYHHLDALDDLPPPNLTDSYSLNEKLRFLRGRSKDAEVIALGSSMTLMNLNSEVVVKAIGNKKYLNAGSWGASMTDCYRLLKVLGQTYPMKTLIMSSNVIDFQHGVKHADYGVIADYLNPEKKRLVPYYLHNLSMNYFINNYPYTRLVRTHPHDYFYLRFDPYGAVQLEGKNFNITKDRWELAFRGDTVPAEQYEYLDSISSYCRNTGIKLIFFQNSYRLKKKMTFDKKRLKMISDHVQKVSAILARDHHSFVDAGNRDWDDKLFVDAIHLNREGTEQVTAYWFDQLQSEKGSEKRTALNQDKALLSK
jgi:hypothetical protein